MPSNCLSGNMAVLTAVLLLAILAGANAGADSSCSDDSISACIHLLDQQIPQQSTNVVNLLTFPPTRIRTICSTRKQYFATCMANLQNKCGGKVINLRIKTAVAAVNFLCGEGYEDYVELSKMCSSSSKVSVKECYTYFMSSIGKQSTNDFVCRSARQKDACMARLMQYEGCGNQAVVWMREFWGYPRISYTCSAISTTASLLMVGIAAILSKVFGN